MATKYLFLNSRDEFYRIEVGKIVYFEANGNYTNFRVGAKLKGIALTSLTKLQGVLSESLREDARMFARIGKRFIVNLNYVYQIDIAKQKLTLSDQDTFYVQLPISKDALRKLRDMYIGIKGIKESGE